MTLVVGYSAQDSGTAALELGSVLARATGEPLVVAVVISTPHGQVQDRVDGDLLGPLSAWGQTVLDRARGSLAQDVEATFEVYQASSIPSGLVELAAAVDASAIVLGSSSKGSLGRISFGSITERLVHSSPRRVFLAPRGFRSGPGSRIRRVNLAYAGTAVDRHLARVADRFATSLEAQLRAVSFVVRPPQIAVGSIEESADELVVQAWASMARARLEAETGAGDDLGRRLARSLVVGRGVTWGHAIGDVAWDVGDVLVVGSSPVGRVARLFLGSGASKIVRGSPVPVLLIPCPSAS